MIFIDNEGNNDPTYNLALEEYAMRNFAADNDYLLFYVNKPSIIIGRNQNTLEEVNQEYVTQNGIHVVRRVSGGGAVYHDFGNLNFSFITNHDVKSLSNFKKFTAPVIKVLRELGLNAELKGRNDIEVDGKKISGTAQFSNSKRMISHGTLLFDTDLSEVAKALHVKMNKIESKGHKSVRARVANISEFLDKKMSMEEFKKLLLLGLEGESEPFEVHHLTKDEWKGVEDLRAKKYNTWEWNYGSSPNFNVKRTMRFPIGEIDVRIFVEKGKIREFKIYGDFFGFLPVKDIEDKLLGIRYELNDIIEALKNIDVKEYFGALEKDEFINLVYGEDEVEELKMD